MSRVRDLKKKSQNIFLKNGFQKWGAINRKLFDLPRSKILHFHFFFRKLKFFCRASGTWKKNHKILFWKMVFKSRVQSIGNCLICLDPKSCNFTFFSRNLDSVEIHCRPYFQRKFKNSPGTFSVWYGSNKCS